MKRIGFLLAVSCLLACAHAGTPSKPASPAGVTLFHADGTAAEIVTERSLPRAEDGCPRQWTRVERFSTSGERVQRTVSIERCGVVEFEMREHYDESGSLLARNIEDDRHGDDRPTNPKAEPDPPEAHGTAIAATPEHHPPRFELATPVVDASAVRCSETDGAE